RRSQGIQPSGTEWTLTAVIRGFSWGIAGWLEISRDFGIAFGFFSALALNLSYAFGFGTNIYRAYQNPRIDLRMVLVGMVRGLMLGLAGAISGAITRQPEALRYGIEIGLVVGTLNALVTVVSPSVEWWADNLPDRVLGGYGAILVLIGSALQTVQYIKPLVARYL